MERNSSQKGVTTYKHKMAPTGSGLIGLKIICKLLPRVMEDQIPAPTYNTHNIQLYASITITEPSL
jgi:hypothetical protein